jgi:hypothetical protein
MVAPSHCLGYKVAFNKIADESTSVPGGSGTFSFFNYNHAPTIDNGEVSFSALGRTEQEGIYTTAGGLLRIAANRNSINPLTSEKFYSVNFLQSPSIRGGKNAFYGRDKSTTTGGGIFIEEDGVLSPIIDNKTLMPGKNIAFETFNNVSMSSEGDVTFLNDVYVSTPETSYGIYKFVNTVLSEVAERGDTMPGSDETFSRFSAPTIHSENVAFRGINNKANTPEYNVGIYTDRGGKLRKVVDTSTEMPDGSGRTFDALFRPAIHEKGITFYGSTNSRESLGIYAEENGALKILVDKNTTLPGVSTGYEVGSYASDGHDIVFSVANVSKNDYGSSLYFSDRQKVVPLIKPTDTFDGKELKRIFLDPHGYDDDVVAFKAQFADDTFGIYTATITIPEPTTATLITGMILCLVGFRRRN